MTSPEGSGFGTNSEEIIALGGKAEQYANELADIQLSLDTRGSLTENEIGEYCHQAYQELSMSWSREVYVTVDALREVSTKFIETGTNYRVTDVNQANGVINTWSITPPTPHSPGAVSQKLDSLTTFSANPTSGW